MCRESGWVGCCCDGEVDVSGEGLRRENVVTRRREIEAWDVARGVWSL